MWSCMLQDTIATGLPLRHDNAAMMQVMQHLDQEGCARVAACLRGVRHSSVLLVAQAGTATSQVLHMISC